MTDDIYEAAVRVVERAYTSAVRDVNRRCGLSEALRAAEALRDAAVRDASERASAVAWELVPGGSLYDDINRRRVRLDEMDKIMDEARAKIDKSLRVAMARYLKEVASIHKARVAALDRVRAEYLKRRADNEADRP